jgi:hypothetical protein
MRDLTGFELAGPVWRKSTRSNADNNCVEVAVGGARFGGTVGVRDSKDPGGPVLTFAADGWSAFLAATRAGALHSHR